MKNHLKVCALIKLPTILSLAVMLILLSNGYGTLYINIMPLVALLIYTSIIIKMMPDMIIKEVEYLYNIQKRR